MDWQSLTQLISIEQLIWLTLTLFAYVLAIGIFKGFSHNLLFHPIVIGAILIAAMIAVSTTSLPDYQLFVHPISWMLGPATVALAIPLYQQIRVIVAAGSKGMLVIIIGGCIAPLLALGWIAIFDFSDSVQLSLLTKSITTPLAVDTTRIIGGIPELAAGVVVVTGILGVIFSQVVFKLTRCDDSRVKGLTLGTVSHAIGTARAHQIDAKAGAFSTMALCVNGIITAILLPLFFWLFA